MSNQSVNKKGFVLHENGQVLIVDGKPVVYSPGAFCLIWRALPNGDREIMCVRAQNKPVYGENSVLKGKWGLPGGGIDFPNEDEMFAAIREVREEVNVVLRPDKMIYLGKFGKWNPWYLFSYKYPGKPPKVIKQSSEIKSCTFFKLSEILFKQNYFQEIFYPAQWKNIGWWILYECLKMDKPWRGKGLENPWDHPVLASLRRGEVCYPNF